jgi:quercetin dioxygenase-like cupin family protein
MQMTRNSLKTNAGPSDWFTGTVYIDPIAAPSPPSRTGAASVHFTPGARTAWHTHPLGQTIYVTEGIGRCQREGDRSRRSGRATGSSSSPERTTGTAPPRTAS